MANPDISNNPNNPNSNRDLLTDERYVSIENAVARLQSATLGEDRRQISQAMNDLEAETRTFAAQRMDKTISKAMAGRRIEELAGNETDPKTTGEHA